LSDIRERSLLNRHSILRQVHDNHKMVIEQHLSTGTADANRLWLAVGYFYAGSGRFLDHSFVTPEQWNQLLKDTGRS
jgi:hypothetical protein